MHETQFELIFKVNLNLASMFDKPEGIFSNLICKSHLEVKANISKIIIEIASECEVNKVHRRVHEMHRENANLQN